MEIWFNVIIFVLGLCCGSFVNMLVYRTAVEYELIKSKGIKKKRNGNFIKRVFYFVKSLGGRSFCDSCGRQLKWNENIPVVSWLVQKGKSRCCHRKLSVLYPIVEMMMGIIFLIYDLRFMIYEKVGAYGNTPLQIGLSLVIIIFLVFSGVFDAKYMILPDFSTVILTICAMVFLFVETPDLASLQGKILSAIISFGFLGLLYLITKGKGMGLGDVKLAFFMGLFLGYPKIVVAMYVAFVVGAMFGLILIIFKKAGKKTEIPFGPFLILGTIVAWFWGEQISKFLMSNF